MVGGSGAAVRVPFPRDHAGKKRVFYVRGVAKVKILTLMLHRNRFFYASHGAPRSKFSFLQHLYGKMAKTKCAYYASGVVKREILLPVLRGNRFFLCFSCSVGIKILRLITPLR